MDGKKLFDLLETRIKQGKLSRAKAMIFYRSWLKSRGKQYVSGMGWLTKEWVSGLGLVEKDGEWFVQGIEMKSENRKSNGEVYISSYTAVPKANAFLERERAKQAAFRQYKDPIADEQLSMDDLKDI